MLTILLDDGLKHDMIFEELSDGVATYYKAKVKGVPQGSRVLAVTPQPKRKVPARAKAPPSKKKIAKKNGKNSSKKSGGKGGRKAGAR